jgi:hypothetical protein
MQLPSKLIEFTKIYYFSDGAASQYKKRKNFINLYCHKYGCDMELGEKLKKTSKTNLKNFYEELTVTPRQLYEWAAVKVLCHL